MRGRVGAMSSRNSTTASPISTGASSYLSCLWSHAFCTAVHLWLVPLAASTACGRVSPNSLARAYRPGTGLRR